LYPYNTKTKRIPIPEKMQLKSTTISPYKSPENRMQDIYGQTIENSMNISQYMLKRLDKITHSCNYGLYIRIFYKKRHQMINAVPEKQKIEITQRVEYS
jgi:hypothetical protein